MAYDGRCLLDQKLDPLDNCGQLCPEPAQLLATLDDLLGSTCSR